MRTEDFTVQYIIALRKELEKMESDIENLENELENYRTDFNKIYIKWLKLSNESPQA